MNKPTVMILVLSVLICQMLPSKAQSRYQMSEEIMQAVIVPCTEVAAGGDPAKTQMFLDKTEDATDTLVKNILNIAKHTASENDRMAGYVIWKNFCIANMKEKL